MKKNYYIRLDDACPQMDSKRWGRIEEILDKFSIRPLVGIIPHNEDTYTMLEPEDENFWRKANNWQAKGWCIALHGYNHCYSTNYGGINPIHNRSEFAGITLEIQKKKIKEGYKILKKQGLNPLVFYAPSHTFDENTIKALLEETPIRTISDTIAFKPYKSYGITFIPQQIGQFRNIPISGDFTFCFHPNNMNEEDFIRFENFLQKYRNRFQNYNDFIQSTSNRSRNLLEKSLQQVYYLLHKIRK